MNPNNLRYSKNHEWVGLIDNNENINNRSLGYVGISNFAQKELGDIIFVDVDKSLINQKIKKDKIFGTIEAVKTVSDLFLPISCIILDINNKLLSNPETINQDPYLNGWILKIQFLYPDEYHQLMSFKEYEKYLKI